MRAGAGLLRACRARHRGTVAAAPWAVAAARRHGRWRHDAAAAAATPSPSTEGPHRVPVLVCGAGPVGLTLSLLLYELGVQCEVVEQRARPTQHPQAHFVNVRSLEVFRQLGLAARIREACAPVAQWQRFVYCKSLGGLQLGAFDHYGPDLEARLAELALLSPGGGPTNLPQPKLQRLLLDEAQRRGIPVRFGHRLVGLRDLGGAAGVEADIQRTAADGEAEAGGPAGPASLAAAACRYTAQYLVAADGAGSYARQRAGIGLERLNTQPRDLVSVHFRCPAAAAAVTSGAAQAIPAMLYFVFNDTATGVIVAHDLDRGEFVAQMPFFPPLQTLDEDFSPTNVERMLRAMVGMEEVALEVVHVKQWLMTTGIAERYRKGNVFLAGDACHFFPPSGAFGMNTGIQDAHNLAWRLARSLGPAKGDPDLLDAYERERRPVARRNARLSEDNANRIIQVYGKLGLHEFLGEGLRKTLEAVPLPMATKRSAFRAALRAALAQLQALSDSNPLGRRMISSVKSFVQQGSALPLFFMGQDLGFNYRDSSPEMANAFEYTPVAAPGCRFPHFTIEVAQDPTVSSTLDLPRLANGRDTLLLLRQGGTRKITAQGPQVMVAVLLDGTDAGAVEGATDHATGQSEAVACRCRRRDGEWCPPADLDAVLIRPDGHVDRVFPSTALTAGA